MSCNIQTKTLDHMKRKGLMESNRNIPTDKLEAFELENDLLTERAKKTKNVDLGPLFSVESKTIQRGKKQSTKFVNRAIPNTKAFRAIEKFNDNNPSKDNNGQYRMFQKGYINNNLKESEFGIRDLAARLAHRIGGEVKFESDLTKDYAGHNEGNTSVINLAKATLDTPIHEIVGHPIIRAIRNKIDLNVEEVNTNLGKEYIATETDSKLYQNLLKELETGYGKEVFDRVKRDYQLKNIPELVEMESMTTRESSYEVLGKEFTNKQEALDYQKEKTTYYTLEEQQEEALVQLLGEITAGKLQYKKAAKENKKLISLLKQLLNRMTEYMRSLFNSKEIEIDKLRADMTINDLANLLAYTNSKIILPGGRVEYTTPDGVKHFTYQEASNHISKLFSESKDVDLNDYTIEDLKKENSSKYLDLFIEYNKEYGQTRKVIESWKKENNIIYNPEEAYSRGQEFIHVHNAYGKIDTISWLQNLLNSIEAVKKSDGVMELSFLTYKKGEIPDHLTRNLNKKAVIKLISYPKSSEIAFASKIDNYTSSYSIGDGVDSLQYFIDLSKSSKREQLPVSFTKSVKLKNLKTIEPNIADTIDNVAHHNEYAIDIANGSFRIEYGEETPYEIKKLIDTINNTLDNKYGKINKPNFEKNSKGIQPTQTKENTTSIESVKNNLTEKVNYYNAVDNTNGAIVATGTKEEIEKELSKYEGYTNYTLKKGEVEKREFKDKNISQALINTRIAKYKEVAKKYPRSLITSRVVNNVPKSDRQYQKADNSNSFETKVDFNQLATASKSIFGQSEKSKKNPLKPQESIDFLEEIKMMMFNGKVGNSDAKTILENIKNSGFIKNPIVRELLDKLLLQTKAKVKIVPKSELLSSDTYMQYNSAENTIYISIENLDNVSSVEQAAANFIHEVLHERTHRILNSPKNEFQRNVVDDIQTIYSSLKDTLSEEFPHEMSNIDEFVTGLFSNTEFSERVRNSNRSIIQKVIDILKSLLGLSSSHDVLLNNIMKLTQEENGVEQAIHKTLETKVENDNNTTENDNFSNDPFIEDSNFDLVKISNKIQDRLTKFYEMSIKYNKDLEYNSAFTETIESIVRDINVTKEAYEGFEELAAKEIITKYILFSKGNMESLAKRIQKFKDDGEFDANSFNMINNYLSAFDLIQDVSKLLTDMYNSGDINEKEYRKYKNYVKKAEGSYISNKNTLIALAKQDLIDNDLLLREIKDIEVKYRKRFEKQASQLYTDKNKRKEYVSSKMAENRDVIKKETQVLLKQKLSSIQDDILSISQVLNNEKSINNWIISTLSNSIDKVDSDIRQNLNPILLKLQELSNRYNSINGKNVSFEKLFSRILDKDSNGKYYLKSDYSSKFVEEYDAKLKAINDAALDENATPSDLKKKEKEFKDWVKANTITVKKGSEGYSDEKVPTKKWKNSYNDLTDLEKEILDTFKEIIETSASNTNYRSPLYRNISGTKFYTLPSVRKSTLERIMKGDLKNAAKEQFLEGFTKQTDQTDEGEVESTKDIYKVYTDLDGKELHVLPIHFRNNIENEDQSLDLFTLFSLEAENGIKYKHRKVIEPQMKMFLEVLKDQKYKKPSLMNHKFISKFGNQEEVEQNSENVNILKMFETIMKTRLYDKTKESSGEISGVDVNKFTGAIMSWTSTVGMALNYFSAPANFIIGNVNNMLAVIKDSNMSKSNYTKAANFYRKNMPSMMKDIGKNVDKSLVNQILKIYNTFGNFSDLKNDFVKNTRGKSLFKSDTLQFMHNIGEHAIQGVLTLTIMDSIKILDKDGNYLDINGKKTTIDNAASLLDVQELDKDGNLTTKIPIEYTSFETQLKWDEGGKGSVDSLIKSKMLAAQGNYTYNLKSEFQRRWYGSMLLMYKKHIENPGLDRFRGLGNAFTKNAKDKLKINQSTKEYDEGSYATLVRFMVSELLPKLKSHKLGIIKSLLKREDFKNLDDFEKANINRALIEIGMINLFTTLAYLLASLAGDDDDEVWFAAYLLERASSDLAQYYNPSEAWRILSNPFASMKQVQFGIDMIESVFTPWTLFETYESGIYKGENKAWRKVMRNIPILTRKDLTAKQAYNYLNLGD